MKKYTALLVVLIGTSTILFSQSEKKKWDVNNPDSSWVWNDVKFNTDEGTWMSLDVSPDGKSIVFDMLGDIYKMPITGGKATPIRQGITWEVQPRYSPDGKSICFTSDKGGGDNIWRSDADGNNEKQITKESFRLLNNAEWTADGKYVIARKHFTSSRSLGAGELWMYHFSGGEGFQLTKRKNDQQDLNEPSVSPDGKYVYYSEDMYPGGYFQYNKDPNSQIYVIKRYDLEKGIAETVISGPGGAFRPQVSPDGKHIAFLTRIRTKTVLAVHNLETGEEFFLFDKLSKDQQEAWAIFGVYPGFDWTPDSKHIIISGLGTFWKVDRSTGDAIEIPFEADVQMKVAETLRFKNNAFEEEFDAKVLRHVVTSPDKKNIIFQAMGDLWMMNIPSGKPQQITDGDHLVFEPSFSPDGKQLVYVSWHDELSGGIHLMDIASKQTRQLTTSKGIYRNPKFSPDSKQIVFSKDGGNMHQGFTYAKKPGIYRMELSANTKPTFVTKDGGFPQFNKEGDRIIYQSGGYIFGSLTKTVASVDLNGKEKKEHFSGKYAQRYIISPDNNWVAWSELFKVYVAPFPKTGKKIGLTHKTKAVPVAQVAKDAGINIHWSSDSKQLFWTLGNEYYSDDLTERFSFLEGAVDSIPPLDTIGMQINISMPTDKPTGIVAFTNANIITMENDQVVENGTLIVKDNKIQSIGTDISIPSDATVIDCTDKTIMPGIIDAHAHSGNFRYGLSPQKQWEYYANLAYGVTTSHDPSTNSEMVFANSELIKAGKMVGPRLFSTGTIIYGADGDFKAVINSLDDAKSALKRTKAYGAFSIKSYNQPRRDQRQQVMQAAKELGIIVVPEGGSHFNHNMTMLIDGHTGVEHNIPVVPLYKDVTTLWGATKAHNTPTLGVNYGSVSGEYYWYQHTNVWEKERLLSFTPRPIVDSRARHRTMIPEEEYENGHILTSKSLKKLSDQGVKINLGAHGQLQGLGAHWELWMIQQGGMSNIDALKCATINGAIYLGMDHQIGSLKEGKLADLIVLDANPLDDIRNTEHVKYTMLNGRLYDAATMNEIGNHPKERSKFYFEQSGSGNAYPYFMETNSHMAPQCCLRN